jgi:hypothetical protein
MQSTGQTATHAVSFVPMQGWAMMCAMTTTLLFAGDYRGCVTGSNGRDVRMMD